MKMDEDVSPLEREHSLSVVLPGGLEKNTTVHGSKPVMDLLVTLCASYHLNPSDYTVEVLSPNKNNISFKPNSPIGLLEAEKIILKPRTGEEEKIRTPYMPEATVRLLINYNKSHKAVVRVNPRLPLEKLLPLVCDKCEFEVENTVLLRDSGSKEPLDLSRSLNEHGLREVYARDTAARERSRRQPHAAADLSKKANKPKDARGLFSLFRKHRKHSDPSHMVSAATSPGPHSRSASISLQSAASCTTPPADPPKKRCAPPPPMGVSTSSPAHLNTCALQDPQRSGDGTLRSTKRRAPPPPTPPAPTGNHGVGAATDSVKLEELKKSEEPASVNHTSSSSASSSSALAPPPPPPSSPSAPPPFYKPPDSDRPSVAVRGLSDARTALAKVLTSSLSTGMLAKRLKNSTPFPKTHDNVYAHDAPAPENDIEIEPVPNDADLPDENVFEDPAERKGLTTFKVVPSRRESDTETRREAAEKEEEKENAEEEVEEEEEVIPGTDQSLNTDVSPDQSESGSQVACGVNETESTSCSVPLDRSGSDLEEVEDLAEATKQNEETAVNNDEEVEEDESELSQETDKRDLYLGKEEEEEEEECPAETTPRDDDQIKQNTQDEDQFPPPPPPVFFSEDLNETKANASGSCTNGHEESDNEQQQQQQQQPGSEESESADKAAPSARSMFAQAVAAAVQRSKLHQNAQDHD